MRYNPYWLITYVTFCMRAVNSLSCTSSPEWWYVAQSNIPVLGLCGSERYLTSIAVLIITVDRAEWLYKLPAWFSGSSHKRWLIPPCLELARMLFKVFYSSSLINSFTWTYILRTLSAVLLYALILSAVKGILHHCLYELWLPWAWYAFEPSLCTYGRTHPSFSFLKSPSFRVLQVSQEYLQETLSSFVSLSLHKTPNFIFYVVFMQALDYFASLCFLVCLVTKNVWHCCVPDLSTIFMLYFGELSITCTTSLFEKSKKGLDCLLTVHVAFLVSFLLPQLFF